MSPLSGALSKVTGAVNSAAGSALGGLGSGLTGAAGPVTHSNLTYEGLQAKYCDFAFPMAEIELAGQTFNSESGSMIVSDIHVELSAGFEASIATFHIFNVFDANTGQFKFDGLNGQVLLGNPVTIKLGYLGGLETVFVGFVAGVSFCREKGRQPYIEVTSMDLKGLMMGGGYAAQCTATTYSGAVSEILQRTGYEKLKASGGVVAVQVDPTPDAQSAGGLGGLAGAAEGLGGLAGAAGGLDGLANAASAASSLTGGANDLVGAAAGAVNDLAGAASGLAGAAGGLAGGLGGMAGVAGVAGGMESAYTVELVSESDYEFVVKAAKKFNFEFFVDRGKVIFRKAKSDTSLLATLGSSRGIVTFRVEYSLTGIVGAIEARAMDAGQGKVIKASGTYPGPGEAVSTGSAASGLVGQGKKVYIDPSISSQSDADARVDSLKEKMSYRLGTLEGECVGIPELVPGRFIRLDGLGVPVDNNFYLTSVVHDFTSDDGYRTEIVGRTNKVETGMAGALGGMLGGSLGGAAGAAGTVGNMLGGFGL